MRRGESLFEIDPDNEVSIKPFVGVTIGIDTINERNFSRWQQFKWS